MIGAADPATIRRWREHPPLYVRERFEVEPDPWQDDVLADFPNCQRQAMQACKGPGKALYCGMQIDTPAGPKSWGDLQVGDFVFADDGSPTLVEGVFDRGVLPALRVTFDDGCYLDCCAEHLWRIRGRTERRHKRWAVITTAEIIRRRVREPNGRWQTKQWEIPQQGPAQFPVARQPLDAYAFGVWLGDGTKHSGRYTSIDREIQLKIE